ncbi:MAG: FtsH protease activity modulator HflK [Candidatus Adiutrix sp.]|jgi:membrane protease subunit HflK|nr:FtsH protease activity modulator HflK [Candidatus Adiutrix sp.]
MPMDWDEWQKSRQKNKGPLGPGLPKMGDAFKNLKMPGSGRAFAFLPIILIALWAASGFFTVDPAERGLIKRFGKYHREVGPGLNYHAPFPIEAVIKVNTGRTNRLEIGGNTGTSEETMMLTKDENIADIRFVVQYRVRNAQDYVFQVYDPEKAIRDAATSAMREVIGRNTIDDALTEKRTPIQDDTIQTLQAMLDKYEIGVLIQNVELQEVHVPRDVSQAFRDVTSAREDSVRSENEAQGYSNKVLPEAQGQAYTIEAAARAYASQRINLAQGEASRFKALVAEYKKAPEIMRRRLMLEAMDQILPASEKVLLSGEVGQSLLPHLGVKQAAPAPSAQPATNGQGGR